MRRTISAIFVVLSIVTAFAAFGVQQGTSWTYQGQLQRSGAAHTGTCDFQFTLWDALSAGAQQGGTQTIISVNVVNGLFTVVLDFGTTFTGDARWLGTSVQCSGDGAGFTQLDPRQPITGAPYALSLPPGAMITGSGAVEEGNPNTLRLHNPSSGGNGVYASSVSGNGVVGTSTGVNGAGVFGNNSSGAAGSAAIWGRSLGNTSAIFGEAFGTGYAGKFAGPVDVAGQLTVNGGGTGGNAISGTGPTGVYGITNVSNGAGVIGQADGTDSAGVLGRSRLGSGIYGFSTGAGPAIYGQATSTGFAGRFTGDVLVEGTLFKSAGSFRIDHPLDPANKFLSHSFVESPDMKNIYDGNVITDASGSATVTLPAYFETLNRDYRYQLTVLGQFAHAIVSRKIAGNNFEIRTDKPGVEVSWQVTGIRQDAYAQEHPIVVEEAKPAEQQGKYLYPAGFGAGEEKRIGHLKGPAPRPGAQDPSGAGPSEQGSK